MSRQVEGTEILLALHDGLIGHVVAGDHTPESAETVLTTHLARLFAEK